MATLGDLVVDLRVDPSQFNSGLGKSRKSLSSFASFAKTTVATMTAATTAIATGFAGMAVKLAADAEQTAISFEVMTGSAKNAGKLIADLRKMGAATPFEFTDLANSTKTLLSFGRTQEQVLGDLDMLSNVAAGDAEKLKSLALVFGQIAANGKLMGGDLLQLIGQGFNPLNNIAEKTGESMTELRDRMSKGKIGFEEVRQAFVDATSAGGLFYKMNEKQSKTLLGQWSTMKDEMTSSLIQIGESLIKNLDLKGLTASITQMAATFKEEWIPALEEFIKLAPDLVKAFGQIGEGVSFMAKRTKDWLDAWERITLVAGFAASGQSAEDFAGVMKDMGLAGQKGRGIEIKPDKTGKSLLDVMPATRERKAKLDAERGAIADLESFVANSQALHQKKMIDKYKNRAGQMLARWVSDGIEAMQAGVMSLGPVGKARESMNQVSSLEQGSNEAFEVLRANVGPGQTKDVQKDQLKEQQKQTKKLDEISKKLGNKANETIVKVLGLD